jgi:hypothetical protein
MPRVSKSIQENVLLHPQLSKIIFYLAEQEDNSQGLANRNIGTTQGILYTHLKRLEEENYVLKSDSKRGAYRVNFDLIMEKFYLFLLEEKIKKKFKSSDEELRNILENHPELAKSMNLKEYQEFSSNEVKKKFISNYFLSVLIFKLFSFKTYSSIYTLFSSLHTYFLFENIEGELEDSVYTEEFLNGKDIKKSFKVVEEEVEISRKKSEDFIENNDNLKELLYITTLLQKLSYDSDLENINVELWNLFQNEYIKSKND